MAFRYHTSVQHCCCYPVIYYAVVSLALLATRRIHCRPVATDLWHLTIHTKPHRWYLTLPLWARLCTELWGYHKIKQTWNYLSCLFESVFSPITRKFRVYPGFFLEVRLHIQVPRLDFVIRNTFVSTPKNDSKFLMWSCWAKANLHRALPLVQTTTRLWNPDLFFVLVGDFFEEMICSLSIESKRAQCFVDIQPFNIHFSGVKLPHFTSKAALLADVRMSPSRIDACHCFIVSLKLSLDLYLFLWRARVYCFF